MKDDQNQNRGSPKKNLDNLDRKNKNLQIFQVRKRQRPGPPRADAISAPERDLADAADILNMVNKGLLATKQFQMPKNLEDLPAVFGRDRLSAEVENQLANRIQTFGDIDARNTLVMANIGLVHLVANQFLRPPLRYEDLVQEGTMGLIRATETFEPNRGVRFSTYGVYWIRAKIQRLLQRADREDIPSIIGAEAQEDANGRKRRPRARKLSIERSQENDDSRKLSELLPSESKTPEAIALDQERNMVIKEVLFGIVEELNDDRLYTVIQKRLLTEEPETLTSVGEKLNLSREGARLLESKILKLARQRLKKWRYAY